MASPHAGAGERRSERKRFVQKFGAASDRMRQSSRRRIRVELALVTVVMLGFASNWEMFEVRTALRWAVVVMAFPFARRLKEVTEWMILLKQWPCQSHSFMRLHVDITRKTGEKQAKCDFRKSREPLDVTFELPAEVMIARGVNDGARGVSAPAIT